MSNPTLPVDRARPGAIFAALQVFGLAGASHLLEQLVRTLPGFAGSRLADAPGALAPDLAGVAPFDPGDPVVQALVIGVLVGAVVEELLFRGLLFGALRRWRGPGVAIGVSALGFGLAHADWHQGGIAVLLGLQLGLLREVAGLPLAIAAHLANNALWAGTLFLDPEGTVASRLPSAVSLVVAAGLAGSAWATLAQRARDACAATTHGDPVSPRPSREPPRPPD